jgi:hypothetical protein
MTYGELAKTFEMLAKHKPDGLVLDWATRDEWGDFPVWCNAEVVILYMKNGYLTYVVR